MVPSNKISVTQNPQQFLFAFLKLPLVFVLYTQGAVMLQKSRLEKPGTCKIFKSQEGNRPKCGCQKLLVFVLKYYQMTLLVIHMRPAFINPQPCNSHLYIHVPFYIHALRTSRKETKIFQKSGENVG